jgi:hypothetical protein
MEALIAAAAVDLSSEEVCSSMRASAASSFGSKSCVRDGVEKHMMAVKGCQ